jgi:GNAT superfamily N-acetyltransferase
MMNLPLTLPASNRSGLQTIELTAQHEALLQKFFEQNPDYYLQVLGEPPSSNEAHEEIHADPPPGWSYTKRHMIAYLDQANNIAAMANVVQDLLATHVWHVGFFMVDASRKGTGDAQALFQGIETWAKSNGAHWLRLGVVLGNTRAESFWQSMGFVETTQRLGVEMGQRINTIRVMYKPLCGGSIDQYLALVERDRPSNTETS